MISHSHSQASGMKESFSLTVRQVRLRSSGRKNLTLRTGSSCMGWHIMDFRWITWQKSSKKRFLTLTRDSDLTKERLKMEIMLWHPLRRIDLRRNKGLSEDTWRRMAFSTNLNISKSGVTHLHKEIQTLNMVKMILFNISTTVCILRKTERIEIIVAFLIFFQKSFLTV